MASPYACNTDYKRSVVLVIRNDLRGVSGIVLDSEFHHAFTRIQQRIDALEAPPTEPLAQRLKLRVVNWATEDLHAEVQQGLWLDTFALPEDLVGGDDLWVALVRRIGRQVLHDTLGIERFPPDPMLN